MLQITRQRAYSTTIFLFNYAIGKSKEWLENRRQGDQETRESGGYRE